MGASVSRASPGKGRVPRLSCLRTLRPRGGDTASQGLMPRVAELGALSTKLGPREVLPAIQGAEPLPGSLLPLALVTCHGYSSGSARDQVLLPVSQAHRGLRGLAAPALGLLGAQSLQAPNQRVRVRAAPISRGRFRPAPTRLGLWPSSWLLPAPQTKAQGCGLSTLPPPLISGPHS